MKEKIEKYLIQLQNKFSTLLQESSDDKNAWSMMRFLNLFVVAVPLITWSILCFVKGEILDFPWGVTAIIGLAFGGKVFQKNIEMKSESINNNIEQK